MAFEYTAEGIGVPEKALQNVCSVKAMPACSKEPSCHSSTEFVKCFTFLQLDGTL